jgi:L-2,4-diaminobutyrate decarboxylase
VSLSAHKWLFQPKESAAILFADAQRAHAALSFGGGYLAVPSVGVLGSHGSAALPLAATVLSWGAEGVSARIDRCMQLADDLAALVEADPSLELRARPQTGVVLWRTVHGDPLRIKSRLRDAFVSVVELSGRRWLRSVAANPLADPELVVRSVRAAAAQTPP